MLSVLCDSLDLFAHTFIGTASLQLYGNRISENNPEDWGLSLPVPNHNKYNKAYVSRHVLHIYVYMYIYRVASLTVFTWHGNVFRITGLLWGESTGHRIIPLTKPVMQSIAIFFYISPNKLFNKQSSCRWFETSKVSCGMLFSKLLLQEFHNCTVNILHPVVC